MALVRLRRQPRLSFPGLAGTAMYPAFEDAENRLSRFFERAMSDLDVAPAQVIGWVPATDIVETPDELTITAELPGMDQKDIDLTVEEGVLTIRGEKTEEHKEGDGNKPLLYERTYGAFQRTFALPPNVDATKASAEFVKGVLRIKMPRLNEPKVKGQKIEIK